MVPVLVLARCRNVQWRSRRRFVRRPKNCLTWSDQEPSIFSRVGKKRLWTLRGDSEQTRGVRSDNWFIALRARS
jgi:hypothetical protein